MTALSLSQIKAQVAAIRQKVPDARVVGFHTPDRWTESQRGRDADHDLSIHQCDSPLSFRLALRLPADDHVTKVLITGLEDQDLGQDALLRLAKRRLFPLSPWQAVRSLFDAHAVDPRLTRCTWIAETLLENAPNSGYPAARGGFLDAETVWPLLLERAIGLRADSHDLTGILRWSLDGEATDRFRRRPETFRVGAAEWFAEKAGDVAIIVLRCVERLQRPDVVPVGLAAAVVYHPHASGRLEKSTGKLEERFLGGESPDAEAMTRWGAAATEVTRALRHTDPKAHRQVVQRADEILREIQADALAFLSDTSPLGFDQRLAHAGEALSQKLQGPDGDRLQQLTQAHRDIVRHDQSGHEARRLERVEMAMRLVRWLGEQHDTPSPKSLGDAAEAHLREGGYVDWARLSLRSGDPVGVLSEAYARLFDRVRQIREQQSRDFANLLADWTAAGSEGDQVLPVERVLEEVVAPLAAEGLVLVVLVDGMSVGVCRELMTDLTRHEWIALAEPGRQHNRAAAATIPSVTEYSRTSLLCGRLTQGDQNDEKAGFAAHPALLARSRSGSPPVLFHKALLQEAGDSVLAAEVRKEIASTHRRVVGVVVNAVDDHLLKGDQIDTRWSRDSIRVLPALLHEARIARRLVVLLSDHGHVLDCQAEGRPFKEDLAGGERWRSAAGEPADEELLVEGSRVLGGGGRLIAPWSERVRYGIKKNGYHGGLSPQEVVAPIVVLSSTDEFPAGWSEAPVDTPTWWDDVGPAPTPKAPTVPELKPVAPKPTGTLFDLDEQAPLTADADGPPPWVANLLQSPVFEDQRRLGGRGVPDSDVFARLLAALDERGGKMTSVALARLLGLPAFRLAGLLAKAERVLNVDGYDVLRREEASDTIELNRGLLLKQFDLVE